MAFNDLATARAEVLMERLGETGDYLGDQFEIPGITGIFQWSWVVDPVSGVTMERQLAKVKMLASDVDDLDIAAGDRLRFRDIEFRVGGLLPNDAGMTTIELTRVVT